jgi:hypothetical protein
MFLWHHRLLVVVWHAPFVTRGVEIVYAMESFDGAMCTPFQLAWAFFLSLCLNGNASLAPLSSFPLPSPVILSPFLPPLFLLSLSLPPPLLIVAYTLKLEKVIRKIKPFARVIKHIIEEDLIAPGATVYLRDVRDGLECSEDDLRTLVDRCDRITEEFQRFHQVPMLAQIYVCISGDWGV